ncbi:restriction endonuclease [Pseudoduganella violacea]|uniref:Restriction endonuclease type IV Mrr domain-containing protein n=1 Tax=Pseudoduganella violacea TaxID=1715466 RepID=A0A7W5FUE3_9BURK|nr:restriction endonuclease [Pseudoduganella violacea]MBB3119662.1 hypothetical protein [Pseudoduganella violacea]
MKTKIKALSPTQFENLVFDTLHEKGMVNLIWRTPGADGGRDIEGTFSTLDISGYSSIQKWYVECKRYKASVDWPTIREKLAYAENHDADYLLMTTSSTYSPNAISETERWNSKGRRPQIRLWPISQLEIEIKSCPNTAYKYGLERSLSISALPFLTIIKEIAKQLAISESKAIFNDRGLEKETLLAKEMAWLVYSRISQKEEQGYFSSYFHFNKDDVMFSGNYTHSGNPSVDLLSLRAIVAYIALCVGMENGTVNFHEKKAEIRPVPFFELSTLQRQIIESIASWGNLSISYDVGIIGVDQQDWQL